MNWNTYFCSLAHLVAQKSKDPSTKVGAVLVGPANQVLSTGYNGFPRGVAEKIETRWVPPTKYLFVEHAERNAIYNAARHGVRLEGAMLYLNWDPVRGVCTDCARAIIQSGVTCVVGPAGRPFRGAGAGSGYDVDVSGLMFNEAGVGLVSAPMEDVTCINWS